MATSMSGRMPMPTLSELARYAPAQLAVEMVEEVPLPLFVLLRRHQSPLSITLGQVCGSLLTPLP